MIRKTGSEYPKRDLTPEHTKRGNGHDSFDIDQPIHVDVNAAYDYVNKVLDTSDYKDSYLWHGWALREAFLAGISHAKNLSEQCDGWDEKRIDTIGQNGNDGLHYPK